MAGLDEILNPSETEETEQEVVEAAVEETGAEETQVAAETEEKPATPDPAEQVRAELAALTKERQRLREKEAAWEQERQQFLSQRQTQEEAKPDFWENPEAVIQQQMALVQQALVQQKVEITEAVFRRSHPDYDEKVNTFLQLAESDPALLDKARKSTDPAEFAYKTATDHARMQELQQIGDPSAYREKILAEESEKIRAQLEQEYAARHEAEKKRLIEAKLGRGGFASERSSSPGGAGKKTYTGPTPLGDILGL